MVVELLAVGKENAKSTKYLTDILGLRVRDVREIIRRERLAGELICSSQSGYYLPENVSDVRETVMHLYAISRETKAVADRMTDELTKQ